MDYIPRHLERKFTHMSEFFKAVLVTGARQVGKTTMLKHLAEGQNRTYVTLDNKMARELAQGDPVLFFQTYKPPILIDEVQYAPELFPQIKILCDESEETGRFWLAGSQQYKMITKARETLAGRVSILSLYSLSQTEKAGLIFQNDLDFSLTCLQGRQALVPKNDVVDVFEHIWRGGMPQVLQADAEQRQEYYDSYTNTFLMRDVAELGGVTDTLRFGKFLTACASLVGEQVNYKTLAETADISQPTAKAWLQLLEGLCIVYLLAPYANNALKRLTKTPKLYFCDTGLAAHLSMWLTRETLMTGAASGHFFENYVISELLKSYAYSPLKANMTYYRDSNAKEIDIFIEENNSIHPLEIKKSANPDRREIKKFSVLEKTTVQTGAGGIICMCEETIPIDPNNCFIPCNLI
ncbi:MAG: ATP-binding protein [Christensenellaceae bacterium]|jgi:predicted AAA+ superfamily ATPase|nr:ATP-binding protein [Christensenellaceae bacterium]